MEKIVYLIIAVGLILLALGFQVATPSTDLDSSTEVNQIEDFSGDVNNIDQPVSPVPTPLPPAEDRMIDFDSNQSVSPPGLPY